MIVQFYITFQPDEDELSHDEQPSTTNQRLNITRPETEKVYVLTAQVITDCNVFLLEAHFSKWECGNRLRIQVEWVNDRREVGSEQYEYCRTDKSVFTLVDTLHSGFGW